MSGIKEKIEIDLKQALKNRDRVGISVVRMLLSDIHNQEIQNRGPLNEEQVLAVLNSAARKHRDSIDQFQTGDRADLVAQEQAELEVIQTYLPVPLSPEELRQLVRDTIAAVRPQGPQEFGKVMQRLMPQIKGRASGQEVSKLLKEELT